MTKTFQDPELEIIRLKRYEDLVRFIAADYVELSYDKAKNEYLHIIQKCRSLVMEDVTDWQCNKPAKDDF